MTKPKSKSKTVSRRTARKPMKPAVTARAASSAPKARMQSVTKHARIIAMLRAPAGATITAIMALTQWQPHSVRGFLAGVVRKKLGLNLVSEQSDKGRVYRIRGRKTAAAASDQTRHAA
jgi:hypothetical protein